MIECNCIKTIAILNDGVVVNTTVGESVEQARDFAIQQYGDKGDAKDTHLYKVGIGDTYEDGVWKHSDGTEIPRDPSGDERVLALEYGLEEAWIFINELVFPPNPWKWDNYVVVRVAAQVENGSRKIEDVNEDRGLKAAVIECLDRWANGEVR